MVVNKPVGTNQGLNNISIDMASIKSGIYFVQVIQPGNTMRGKVVVK